MSNPALLYSCDRCRGSQKREFFSALVLPSYGSTGGLIAASFRASACPSLKTTTPVFWWRIGSIPSNPRRALKPFAGSTFIRAAGHHKLLLHSSACVGIESPISRFSAGETIDDRLNLAVVAKSTPPTVMLSGP